MHLVFDSKRSRGRGWRQTIIHGDVSGVGRHDGPWLCVLVTINVDLDGS